MLLLTLAYARGQSGDASAVRNLVDSERFTFEAQGVTSSMGDYRNLTTGDYKVQVNKDSVSCFLPYYGHAMMAINNQVPDQLDVHSHKASYKTRVTRKGGWSMSVKPRDDNSVQQFAFEINPDGTATLTVTCPLLDPISFNGYIH